MNVNVKHLLILILIFNLTNIIAQHTTDTSAGIASTVNGNISYSIGQIDYSTNSNLAGSLSQGAQQPYEIFTLDMNDFHNISLKMLVYPNPTTTLVMLRIGNLNFDSLEYNLLDLSGKQISSQKINQLDTQIPLENLPSTTYILNVSNSCKIIKSFKIIKTN